MLQAEVLRAAVVVICQEEGVEIINAGLRTVSQRGREKRETEREILRLMEV